MVSSFALQAVFLKRRRSRQRLLHGVRQAIPSTSRRKRQLSLGQRVSPSGHRSRRCHPAPDPKDFALWTPSRRCRPAPGPKVSPLDTDQRLPPLDSTQGIASPGPRAKGLPPSALPQKERTSAVSEWAEVRSFLYLL